MRCASAAAAAAGAAAGAADRNAGGAAADTTGAALDVIDAASNGFVSAVVTGAITASAAELFLPASKHGTLYFRHFLVLFS